MSPRAKQVQKPLTATELEMMNVIWRLGACSVHQVMDALLPQREAGVHQRVDHRANPRAEGNREEPERRQGTSLRARDLEEDYQIQSLQHLVRNVFDGTPTLLVQRLVSSEQLDPEELDRIRHSLRKKER